ncbi:MULTISPECIES: LysM peptidoglycan-binding domain-containing protein [Sulfitobacter]|uniref:LysM peptidoglycan-binding domain-containing protein n=1 Tax=Sulfitobacter TaxID=60136 RepID=UPI001F0F94E5|nr:MULTISPECIES: LysM peptidoglycan-binding domain-containing protein [Sulfitobacter]
MFKGFGRFGGMGAMAAGAFAAAVLALGAWIGSKRSGPEEAGQTTVAVLPERDATPENATLVPNAVQGVSVGPEDAAATEPKVTQQATEPQAPAFDEVRRESDGMTVIAGRAAPGSSVAVLKDGKEIATATADGSGKFATLAMIPPDGKGHVLTLLGQDGETKLASEEEIILTPNAAPLQMAEADTTPEQSPLGIAEEGADPGGDAAADEGAEPDLASPGDAQVESEASDVTSLAEAEMTREAPADQTASTDAPAEERDEAAIEPAATAPAQATPLAGTATAEAEEAAESQPSSDDGSPTPAAASETATAEQETIEGGGQSEPTETDRPGGSASEQEPAAGEGEIANVSDPTQATPLSDTGTAEGANSAPKQEVAVGESETANISDPTQATPLSETGTAEGANSAPEQEAAAGEGETATVSDPTQATPLSETGPAEGAGSAPEQDQATEAGEDLATGTAPSQATPLAGTGTGAGLAGTGTGAGDNTAPDQGQQATSDALAQATPLAETGTADPATGAADDTASPAQGATTPNPTTDAPSLAERDAPSPETTNPTPTKETDTTAAPAQPSAPAPVLKSTAEGVERLDTAPPQVMTNVALDTIGYSDQGDVQLAGRAQPDTSEVRVYLNNNAVISLPVDQEGRWRGDLPNVDEGVYTLRVDELSRAGDVTSRVETPFKRESPEVLAAATEGLSGPLSAVTVQKGDTLWAISRERYGDPLLYVKVFEANSGNIRDPDLIYPGQVFDLPEEPASE